MKHSFFTAFSAFLFSVALQAQTTQGPVSIATGGSGRAAVVPSEVNALNPAMLAHMKGYYLSGRYDAYKVSDQNNLGWGISISDASEGVAIPASVGFYQWKSRVAGQDISFQDVNLGFAGMLLKNFSVGLVGRRFSTSGGSSGDRIQHNLGAGLLYIPIPILGVALTTYDVLETPEIPMNPTVSTAANVIIEGVARFALDVSFPQKANEAKRYQYALGIESLFAYGFKLRAGHNWDNFNSRRYASAGLGWDAPKFNLDYAYQKTMDVDEYRHIVDLRIQF